MEKSFSILTLGQKRQKPKTGNDAGFCPRKMLEAIRGNRAMCNVRYALCNGAFCRVKKKERKKEREEERKKERKNDRKKEKKKERKKEKTWRKKER